MVPFRRNYGETCKLSQRRGIYWFAGNLMRYAAVGHTANDLPMDSNEFLAVIRRGRSSSAAAFFLPIRSMRRVMPGRI